MHYKLYVMLCAVLARTARQREYYEAIKRHADNNNAEFDVWCASKHAATRAWNAMTEDERAPFIGAAHILIRRT